MPGARTVLPCPPVAFLRWQDAQPAGDPDDTQAGVLRSFKEVQPQAIPDLGSSGRAPTSCCSSSRPTSAWGLWRGNALPARPFDGGANQLISALDSEQILPSPRH